MPGCWYDSSPWENRPAEPGYKNSPSVFYRRAFYFDFGCLLSFLPSSQAFLIIKLFFKKSSFFFYLDKTRKIIILYIED